MKKLLIFVAAIFLLFYSSESQQEEIQSDFEAYLELIQSQQFDKAMDYMYPEFFDLMSREMMVTLMEQTFNSPELTIRLSPPTIDSIGSVEYHDSMYFAPVNYTHFMTMKYIPEETDTKEDIRFRDELAVASLKIKFGQNKVSYDSVTKEMLITSHKLVYARSKDGETNWKFIELDPENMFMIKSMIPEELYNRATSQSR